MKLHLIVIILVFGRIDIVFGQTFNFITSASKTYWTKGLFNKGGEFLDSNITSHVDNSQNKILDFGLGFEYNLNSGNNIYDVSLIYEFNSVQSRAKQFYNNGELIRRFNLHFLNCRFGWNATRIVLGKEIYLGFGIMGLFNIGLNRTKIQSKLTYVPNSQFGAVYYTSEIQSLLKTSNYSKFGIITPGLNLNVKMFVGASKFGRVYLFLRPTYTLGSCLGYNWNFRNIIFALDYSNRLNFPLGLGFEINNKTK